MRFTEWIERAATLFEVLGVAVMVAGLVFAAAAVGLRRPREPGQAAYRRFRNLLGQAILLGLELLVAADIIRTVSQAPTLRGVLVLGLIVFVRTFLSFTLEVELEGHWPWQRARLPGGPHRS